MDGEVWDDYSWIGCGVRAFFGVGASGWFREDSEIDSSAWVMRGAEPSGDFKFLHRTRNDVMNYGMRVGADALGVRFAIGAQEGCSGRRFVDFGFAPALCCGFPLELGEWDFFAFAVGENGVEPAAVIAAITVAAFFDHEVEVIDSYEADFDVDAFFIC